MIEKQSKALILMADGTEELEAISVINVLRRGQMSVTLGSCTDDIDVKCSQKTVIRTCGPISKFVDEDYDVIVVPGGMPGAANIAKNATACDIVKRHFENDRLIAAICASPSVVLKPLGILQNRRACGYPADCFPLDNATDNQVEIDKKVITSQGPGTALRFALTILREIAGVEEATRVARAMLIHDDLE